MIHRFRLWLENRVIDIEEAINIVLDAAGASTSEQGEKRAVLSSKIDAQPELQQKLKKYGVVKEYMDQIEEYILANSHKSLHDLAIYISELDHVTLPTEEQ